MASIFELPIHIYALYGNDFRVHHPESIKGNLPDCMNSSASWLFSAHFHGTLVPEQSRPLDQDGVAEKENDYQPRSHWHSIVTKILSAG